MTKIIKKRKFIGQVISDKMDKTDIVQVASIKTHSKYLKQYKKYKRYKAHDTKNEYHTGDWVVIEAIRPLSREKRWRIVKKIT